MRRFIKRISGIKEEEEEEEERNNNNSEKAETHIYLLIRPIYPMT